MRKTQARYKTIVDAMEEKENNFIKWAVIITIIVFLVFIAIGLNAQKYKLEINYDTLKYEHAMDLVIPIVIKLPEPKTITVSVPCNGLKTTVKTKGFPTASQNLKFNGKYPVDGNAGFKDCEIDTLEVSKAVNVNLVGSSSSTLIALATRPPELANSTLFITLDNSAAAMDLKKLTNYKISLKNGGSFTALNDWIPIPGSVISDNRVTIYSEGLKEWDTASSKSFPPTALIWRSTADKYSGTYSIEMKSTVGRSDIIFSTPQLVSSANYKNLTMKLKQTSPDLLGSGRFIWVLLYRNGVNIGGYQVRNGAFGVAANTVWNSVVIPLAAGIEFNAVILAYPAGLKSSLFIDDIQLEN